MTFRTSLALGAIAAAAVVSLSGCGIDGALAADDTAGTYPTFTASPTAVPPNPLLTKPGTVLRVGQSAVIGYHTLVPSDSGDTVAGKDEQLITVTVAKVEASSISAVPSKDRLKGADAGGISWDVKKVIWTAKIEGPSVISMAKNGLEFRADGAGAYIVSEPTLSGCPGRAALGSAFDKGETVSGCFLVVYQADTTTPSIEQFVYRTPTELDPIVWKP